MKIITESKLRSLIRQELKGLLTEGVVLPSDLSIEEAAESIKRTYKFVKEQNLYSYYKIDTNNIDQLKAHIKNVYPKFDQYQQEELAKLIQLVYSKETTYSLTMDELPNFLTNFFVKYDPKSAPSREEYQIYSAVSNKLKNDLNYRNEDYLVSLVNVFANDQFEDDREGFEEVISELVNLVKKSTQEQIDVYKNRTWLMKSMESFLEKKEIDQEMLESIKNIILDESDYTSLIQAAELYGML
jgi:hypothetical protein